MLVILSGLPGVGKTAIARALAREIGAVHLRIDSIEQSLGDSAPRQDVAESGYRVAYAVAEDNLRIGLTVIADCVNPIPLTRDAWLAVADRAGAKAAEIEVICSDAREHRRRVEARESDIPGLAQPSWPDVMAREYHGWDRDRLVVDTAGQSIERSVEVIRVWLGGRDARAE